ncbi:hypothetical protein [Agrobacterium radiobacter]|uniref:hypothetical protein n=1 Tax=Agrobacterium radiobacter TaxID=362 RepID=UPI003F85B59C
MEIGIPKLIYLVSKKQTLTDTDFVSRWRAHGDLAMRNPRWKHVAADSDVKPAGIPIKDRPPFRFEADHYSNQRPATFRH